MNNYSLISFNLSGRLCNNIREIFTCFLYCNMFNIPYENIVINKEFKDSIHNEYPIIENFNFFRNIKNIFISSKDFNKISFIKINEFNKEYIFSTIQKSNNILINKNNLWIKPKTKNDFLLFKKLFINTDLLAMYQTYLINKFNNKYIIGCHIRRTDFSIAWNGKYLQTIQEIYLKIDTEIEKAKKQLLQIQIIIYSDDIEWCKKNITKYNNIYFFEKNLPYEDLIFLSLSNIIIKNNYSSFSDTALIINKLLYYDT